MIRIGRLLKIRHMAGFASRRKPQVSSHGGVLMALVALQDGVRAEQRKPVEVILNRLHRRLPAQNRVAPGTVVAKLRAVNIRVTIGAVLAHVGEHRPGVASRAGYFFVHAAQRVARRVVVEFGNGANGNPACARVAIFARNGEGTVRTSARLSLSDRGHDHG